MLATAGNRARPAAFHVRQSTMRRSGAAAVDDGLRVAAGTNTPMISSDSWWDAGLGHGRTSGEYRDSLPGQASAATFFLDIGRGGRRGKHRVWPASVDVMIGARPERHPDDVETRPGKQPSLDNCPKPMRRGVVVFAWTGFVSRSAPACSCRKEGGPRHLRKRLQCQGAKLLLHLGTLLEPSARRETLVRTRMVCPSPGIAGCRCRQRRSRP